MVSEAKNAKNRILPFLGLHISEQGVKITDPLKQLMNEKELMLSYPLEAIRYIYIGLSFRIISLVSSVVMVSKISFIPVYLPWLL